MPIAIMGDFGLQPDKSWATTFGLQANDLNITAPLRLKGKHAAMEFEIALPHQAGRQPRLAGGAASCTGRALVEFVDKNGRSYVGGSP